MIEECGRVRGRLLLAKVVRMGNNIGMEHAKLEHSPVVEAVRELRIAPGGQAKRRAAAHRRIEAKRRANSTESLLALLERPEYKIVVNADVLREILESYSEDD